jgi:hypothetical protein
MEPISFPTAADFSQREIESGIRGVFGGGTPSASQDTGRNPKDGSTEDRSSTNVSPPKPSEEAFVRHTGPSPAGEAETSTKERKGGGVGAEKPGGDNARETGPGEGNNGEENDDKDAFEFNSENAQVQKLTQRDREVRAHEQAHIAAGGRYVVSGANYSFQRGPDGKLYAVGGEVSIDTSEVPGDPEATIRKMRQIRAAALAPADPSAQDRAVAAKAGQIEAEARREAIQMKMEEGDEGSESEAGETTGRDPAIHAGEGPSGNDSQQGTACPPDLDLYA